MRPVLLSVLFLLTLNDHQKVASKLLEEDCGIQGTFNKILDGEYTAIDEFPWLARIGFLTQSKNGTTVVYSCGGALIHKRAVLTAGHCMAYLSSENQLLYNVILGEYDTKTVKDCVEMFGYTDCADPVQDIRIQSYALHPNYLGGFNDIGLLFLERDAQFTEFVQPICLPEKNSTVETEEKYTVSGWGKTELGNDSNIKLKISIPVRNFADCYMKYAREKNVVLSDKYHFCAGSSGKDTCAGDSGLPMMSTKGSSPTWKVYGITSRGFGCGKSNWPGIYTKVSAFIDWINDEIERFEKIRTLFPYSKKT